MKVKDIIKKVSLYLKLQDVLDYYKVLEENENSSQTETTESEKTENVTETTENVQTVELSSETEYQINMLLENINNVLEDIATNYIPLKMIENIDVSNNSFNLNNLSKNVNKVIRITKDGMRVNFFACNDMLKTENGNLEITYSYIPNPKTLDDEIENFYGKVGVLTYAYGVASEYCLINEDYEQAMMWDDKFKNALLNSNRPIKNISIKKRRWF